VPTPPVAPGWSDQKLHFVTHDNIKVLPETYMYVCLFSLSFEERRLRRILDRPDDDQHSSHPLIHQTWRSIF
jgi:hypothetical protein